MIKQDERCQKRYEKVKSFIVVNHRNPSKYYPEEKLMVHFIHHNKKLRNAGELKPSRVDLFIDL